MERTSPLKARDEKRATGTEVPMDAEMTPGRPLCDAASGGGRVAGGTPRSPLAIHPLHPARAVWPDPRQWRAGR
eukprot:6207392-Pleurochrysis_carterae.AAC.1